MVLRAQRTPISVGLEHSNVILLECFDDKFIVERRFQRFHSLSVTIFGIAALLRAEFEKWTGNQQMKHEFPEDDTRRLSDHARGILMVGIYNFQCHVMWDYIPIPCFTSSSRSPFLTHLHLSSHLLLVLCYRHSSFLCYGAICLCSTPVGIFNPGFDTFTHAQFSVCPPNQLGLIQRSRTHLFSSPSAFVTKPNYPPSVLAYYQPHPLQSPMFPVSVQSLMICVLLNLCSFLSFLLPSALSSLSPSTLLHPLSCQKLFGCGLYGNGHDRAKLYDRNICMRSRDAPERSI